MQTQIAPRSSYSREDWQRGYASLKQEFTYNIDQVEGEIPTNLSGTLFRNGPGLFDVNGQRIHHPFDGDGMISAVTFQNGRAHFRNRFVRTEGYVAEQQAGRILYRGVFGTQKPGGWLNNLFDFRLKNIANTNVIYWADRLLALWEAAEPHRLDPATLETLGLDDLDGILKPGSAFSAHPRIDLHSEQDGGSPCLVNFAIKPGLSSEISVYEISPIGRLLRQYSAITPGFCFIHDFVITPHYCVFFQNPVSFNPLPFALGMRSAGECITFQPDQLTKVILVPRSTEAGRVNSSRGNNHSKSRTFEIPSGFVFHHANAFEQGSELVIDSICYASLPSVEPDADFRQTNFEALAPGQLWRFRLNLETGTTQQEMLEERCCEFPTIHPDHVGRPYRYVYLAAADAPTGNAPNQAILKLDLDSGQSQLWTAAPKGFVSEPVFVPKPGGTAEDDGWLLAMVFDAECDRSYVAILDASDLERGTVARLYLKHHVPYGLHGSFTPHSFVDF
jgi:all-trans-8'-apo-beta-carotenal 15,15'-oxygenase